MKFVAALACGFVGRAVPAASQALARILVVTGDGLPRLRWVSAQTSTVQGSCKTLILASALRWASLADEFAESVYVDYTSLFGGYPRHYTAEDLVDNWRQLLEPFSMTNHVLGPIVVQRDKSRLQAKCPVRISHFLGGAPGGEEWIVIGQFTFTLEKQEGRWRVQGLVLDVQSQEGNSNLLSEAFASPDKRLPCEECVAGKGAQPGQPPSTSATDLKPRT